jgi:hypothetical protein
MVTDDEKPEWMVAFDALPVDPVVPSDRVAETAQERRTRVHVEAEDWRRRIEEGSDPATDAALVERIKAAIVELGGDPDRWTEWDAAPPPVPGEDGRHALADYLIDWSDFWDADLDEQEWLLEPLLARRRAHSLYAGAKTGKSYLILAACAALATGRAFLDHEGGTPVDVLYVDYEMTLEDLRDRLIEYGYGAGDDLSHLHYALLPSLPPLDTEEGGLALLDAAMSVGAQFVIIDTLSRSVAGDENSADTMRAFYRHTGLLLKQNGIGWMRLDHAGKDGGKALGARGSSAKNDDVDIVVRLERTDAGQKLVATHRRMGWYPELTLVSVTTGADGVVRFGGDAPSWPDGTKDCADDLDRLGAELDVSQNRAVELLRAEGLGRRKETVKAALRLRRDRCGRAVDNLDPTALQTPERGSGAEDLVDPERALERGGAHPSASLVPTEELAGTTLERGGAHQSEARAPICGTPTGAHRADLDPSDDLEDPFS